MRAADRDAMTHLLLSEIFPPAHGGSGRWFWEIYRRLPRADFLIAAGQHPRQDDFDATHDLRLVRLPLHMSQWGLRSLEGLRGYWRQFGLVRSLLRREKVELIHCGRCLPEGFVGWLLQRWAGVPYLVFVHGEDVTTAATSRELSWMVRRTLGGARRVIANSQSTRRILLEQWRLPEDQVRLLHPGVDTKRFTPALRDQTVRARLGWQGCVVLTVGRLQKRKGHDMLIRALPALRQQVPDVFYAIIGGGEERAALEALATALGVADRVRFHGEADDATLTQAYQQCDLFALPNRTEGSDMEGFGMVLLEAQASGRPVLAGDSGGTAETMQQGVTGRIVSCDRPEPLTAVLVELLSQPQSLDRMGDAGRRWVVERFDWDALTRQAAAIFRGA